MGLCNHNIVHFKSDQKATQWKVDLLAIIFFMDANLAYKRSLFSIKSDRLQHVWSDVSLRQK